MITNKQNSCIGRYAIASSTGEHISCYILYANFKSRFKNIYLSYINRIGFKINYDIYCVQYWTKKEE